MTAHDDSPSRRPRLADKLLAVRVGHGAPKAHLAVIDALPRAVGAVPSRDALRLEIRPPAPVLLVAGLPVIPDSGAGGWRLRKYPWHLKIWQNAFIILAYCQYEGDRRLNCRLETKTR